jgi:hypothetical protein
MYDYPTWSGLGEAIASITRSDPTMRPIEATLQMPTAIISPVVAPAAAPVIPPAPSQVVTGTPGASAPATAPALPESLSSFSGVYVLYGGLAVAAIGLVTKSNALAIAGAAGVAFYLALPYLGGGED